PSFSARREKVELHLFHIIWTFLKDLLHASYSSELRGILSKNQAPKKRQQPSFHIIFMPDVSSTSDFFLIIFSAAGSDQAQCLLLWNQSLHPFLLFSAVCHRSPVGADHISVDILSPRQSVRETGQTPSRRRHYNDSCLRRRFQRAYSFCRHLASAVQAGTIHIHCQQTDIFPLRHIFYSCYSAISAV